MSMAAPRRIVIVGATSSIAEHCARRGVGFAHADHFARGGAGAEELAKQTEDAELASAFADVAGALRSNEQTIVDELLAVQGQPADIGGYYAPDAVKATAVMRPSPTFNAAIDAI